MVVGRIQTYRSRARPSGRAKRAPAPYPFYGTMDKRAAEGFGRAVSAGAASILQEINNKERDGQISTYEVDMQNLWNDYSRYTAENPDMPDLDLSELRSRLEKGKEAVFAKITNREAKRVAEQNFKKISGTYEQRAWAKARGQFEVNETMSFKANFNAWTVLPDEDMTLEQVKERITKLEKLVMRGQQDKIAGLHNPEYAISVLNEGKRAIWRQWVSREAEKKALLEGTETGLEFINQSELTKEDKEAVERDFRTKQAQMRSERERIQRETWVKNEQTELFEPWIAGDLTPSRVIELSKSGAISRRDRDGYFGVLEAEKEIEVKRQAAETKILEAKDKREVMRFLSEGIEKGEINKNFIYIVAENYDFTSAELEGFVDDYNANKNAIVSYEPQAELIELTTGVQSGEVEPDDVKTKIKDMMQKSISAGLPKDEAVTLGLKYREKLATATKERDRSKAYLVREGRGLMEELIRDKDPITGVFTDDERQILGSAEAILILEDSIERAIKADKPLEGTDLLIEAMNIGRRIKKRITAEDKMRPKPPPTFTPPSRAEIKPKEAQELIPPEPIDYGRIEKMLGKDKADMETKAWGVIYDVWYELSKATQNKIRNESRAGKSFTELLNEPGIMAEVNAITKRTLKKYKHTATNPTTGERVGSNDGIKWEPIR